MEYFSLVDFLYGPIALLIIIIFARVKKYKLLEDYPEYKYYTKGLYVKLIGSLALSIIYSLYYGGGDTINYFSDSVCMMRLLFVDPVGFYDIMTTGLSLDRNFFYFNESTGYPIYFRDDQATFYVVRLATPIVILSAGSMIVTALLFAYISYMGTWRLYKVFIMEFPDLKKEMAIAILFIPSVFFWGSGILKDTITLTCVGFYTHSFYMIFIRGEKIKSHLIIIFIVTYLIIMIKPYIVFALLPGSIIWVVNKHVGSMNNKIIKVLVGPFIIVTAALGGYFVLANMGDILGAYSVDRVLEKAVITNQDLKAEYYGGSSFDIGDFDPTIPSMLSKAPAAITAAIFRPYIWEANNIVMIVSGLECFILLIFALKTVYKLRLFGIIPLFVKNHLLTFSLIFSLFFAFSVGISTSNFGSLVRYRIPVLPFFIASLYIMQYLYSKKGEIKINEEPEVDENDDEIEVKPGLA